MGVSASEWVTCVCLYLADSSIANQDDLEKLLAHEIVAVAVVVCSV